MTLNRRSGISQTIQLFSGTPCYPSDSGETQGKNTFFILILPTGRYIVRYIFGFQDTGYIYQGQISGYISGSNITIKYIYQGQMSGYISGSNITIKN